MVSEDPIAVSLFSGLGGMDIGLHQAGIHTAVCVEKDSDAVNTLKANSQHHDYSPQIDYGFDEYQFPWKVIDEDIQSLDKSDILDAGELSLEDIDLVVGGPPCQTFSRSNEGDRDGTNSSRGSLYLDFARMLHSLEPKAFIFENVRGLISSNDGDDLEKIKSSLSGENFDEVTDDDLRSQLETLVKTEYSISTKILNAADFGVPQTRQRLFILGRRDGITPRFPTGDYEENWVDVGTALKNFNADKDIESVGGYQNATRSKYGYLLRQIPEGANYQHFSEKKYNSENGSYTERTEEELEEKIFDWRSRHWNYLLKLDRERPSWTIQADPGTTVGPFHWRSRPLALLEQMRLMDIPVDYYISGSPKNIQKQIGNAVPPSLAGAVGRHLCKQLGLEPSCQEQLQKKIRAPTEPSYSSLIEVDRETSPWENGGRIIAALESGETVNIQAQQGAIPYAIDAVELALRHASQQFSEDQIIADESITKDTAGQAEFGSVLSVEVNPSPNINKIAKKGVQSTDD